MRATPRDPTDDPELLHTIIADLRAQLSTSTVLVEKLKLEIARLKRQQFGQSSEKLGDRIAQLELIVEDLEASQAEQAVPTQEPVSEAHRPARRPLPDHLPREAVVMAPNCECPECGGAMRVIGEDVSEMLERVPEQFKVIRFVRPKLSCAKCQRIVQQPAASRPIARGLAGPGMLAHILVSKYVDHLPLYRQEQIYARDGLHLDRSTLADMVGGCARLLAPLVTAIERHTLQALKLHADDTLVPVLQPGRGTTKTGRLWTYVRDDRPAGSQEPASVWFKYSPDRKGERPVEHLRRFAGILQADGYAGFNRLYERGDVLEAACWAHVRRSFFDIHASTASPIANEALQRIRTLYDVESLIRGKTSDERRAVRQARAGLLLAQLKHWLGDSLASSPRRQSSPWRSSTR